MSTVNVCSCKFCSEAWVAPGERYSFLRDGPPKRRCEWCPMSYEDYWVPNEDWNRLPEGRRRLHLCEADFFRAIRDAGHNPEGIVVDKSEWQMRVKVWEEWREDPVNYVHLFAEHIDFSSICGVSRIAETMNCLVLVQTRPSEFIVRLCSNSPYNSAYRMGNLYVAAWDGRKISVRTGRPVLTPVRSLPASKRIPKKGPGRWPWDPAIVVPAETSQVA